MRRCNIFSLYLKNKLKVNHRERKATEKNEVIYPQW